jgi:regulator of PEP synthase PpsR (kinase-PPPase family)
MASRSYRGSEICKENVGQNERIFGRHNCRLKDTIKMDLEEIGLVDVV